MRRPAIRWDGIRELKTLIFFFTSNGIPPGIYKHGGNKLDHICKRYHNIAYLCIIIQKWDDIRVISLTYWAKTDKVPGLAPSLNCTGWLTYCRKYSTCPISWWVVVNQLWVTSVHCLILEGDMSLGCLLLVRKRASCRKGNGSPSVRICYYSVLSGGRLILHFWKEVLYTVHHLILKRNCIVVERRWRYRLDRERESFRGFCMPILCRRYKRIIWTLIIMHNIQEGNFWSLLRNSLKTTDKASVYANNWRWEDDKLWRESWNKLSNFGEQLINK